MTRYQKFITRIQKRWFNVRVLFNDYEGKNWLCRVFGHRYGLDDLAGMTLFEVCRRPKCAWVGRCLYDGVTTDEATLQEIKENQQQVKADNERYNVLVSG